MIAFMDMEFAPLVAIAAVLSVLTIVFCRSSGLRRRRTLQLVTAGELLRSHMQLLETILSDDRVPSKIKSRALSFSEIISDRSEFLKIFNDICSDISAGKLQNENSAFEADIAVLNAIEDGLGQRLTSMVSAGTAAMLLQYAHVTETAMAKLYADRRTETSLFASAVRRAKNMRQDDGPLPPNWVGAT